MRDLIARARVLLTALPTWLAAAVAVLTVVQEDIQSLLDELEGVPAGASWLVYAGVVVPAVVATIRRLQPAEPAERGLLAPEAD